MYPCAAGATFFVAGFSPDFAVVAIDSRMILGRTVSDAYCKIRPLSKNAFFFARGSTSAYDNEDKKSVFDARDIAQNVFAGSGRETPPAADLARSWADRMKSVYDKHPLEFAREAVDGLMAEGFFVGTDADGKVTLSGQAIRYQGRGKDRFFGVSEPVLSGDPGDGPKYVSDHRDIVKEFSGGGKTARAKKVLARIDPSLRGPDAVAARYSAYVESVRDWSRDKGIGGQVATVILESGKGWRWFRRPGYCPEK